MAGTSLAIWEYMMTYIDLLIIYLACGSSFGVYYFFNQNEKNHLTLLKSTLIILMWVPFALSFVYSILPESSEVKNKLARKRLNPAKTVTLSRLRKEFEEFLPANDPHLSLFQFREILERYVGLTLINMETNAVPANHEKEIFRIINDKDVEISSICLNRINRKKIVRHHDLSREEFLNTIYFLIKSDPDNEALRRLTFEMIDLLNDVIARTSLDDFLKTALQIHDPLIVNRPEKELWTLRKQNLTNLKQISMTTSIFRVTTGGRKKD